MKKLSAAAQARARQFINEKGRPLERALADFHFDSGAAAAVLQALGPYQNDDGGFGNALEPDLRLADSSAIATSVGFHLLKQVGAPGDSEAVQRGIDYLKATLDAEKKVWPIIPPAADGVPRAPWWDYAKSAENFGDFMVNPRADLVSSLLHYAEEVDGAWLQVILDDTLVHLPDGSAEIDMHDLMCYYSLARALPPAEAETVWDKLAAAAGSIVERDPAKWAGYGARPLGLAPVPDTPVAEALGDELLGLNLDYLIDDQHGDGSWLPTWSWFGAYEEDWPQARAEWCSRLTLDALLALSAYGRLES